MKRLSLCLVVLFLVNSLSGQGWKWLNPLPTGNDLKSVFFTDDLTGYAVGVKGTIARTVNGGTDWEIQSSGPLSDLTSVYFTDPNKGLAVGWYGTILMTTNGGYPVGVGDHAVSSSGSWKIYPNPASDILTIESVSEQYPSRLSVTNLRGQHVLSRQISQPTTRLDLSHLPRGVYFLRLTGDKSLFVSKFIKQ